jgi:hypothetical protein
MLMILLRVAYNPVFVNGDGTLYIVSHHQLAENVYGWYRYRNYGKTSLQNQSREQV